jgi:hypothetical protein
MARHSILNVLLMIVLATFVLPAAARARRKASPDLLGSIFWGQTEPPIRVSENRLLASHRVRLAKSIRPRKTVLWKIGTRAADLTTSRSVRVEIFLQVLTGLPASCVV